MNKKPPPDIFDNLDALRIDPTDPTLIRNQKKVGEPRPRKVPRRQFVIVPWIWIDQLKTKPGGGTFKLALLLLFEHWRAGSPIHLTNALAAQMNISPDAKERGLDDLEQMELVRVERRSPKSAPWVTVRHAKQSAAKTR
jgi:hypothetical protein